MSRSAPKPPPRAFSKPLAPAAVGAGGSSKSKPSSGSQTGARNSTANRGAVDRVRAVLLSLPPEAQKIAKDALRLVLYQEEPESWTRLALGLKLDPCQRKLVETPRGKRAIALVHRQARKTTAAAVATAHHLKLGPAGSTSLVLAPTQRQSGEAIRRIRGFLLHARAKLAIDNAFTLQLENGSRVLGLPGQDDATIRGLTVDGVMLVDEAARVSDALFQAAMPMVLRHARTARVMLLSTAWAREGFFYRLWSDGDQRDWLKIEARIDESTMDRYSENGIMPGRSRFIYDRTSYPGSARGHRVGILANP